MIAFIRDPRFFPVLIMVLFACAALRYAYARDWGQVTYWTAALVLNYAVTFMTGAK